MSMHLKPMTQEEESGLRAHGLPVGTPSQLADAFRLGMAWADKARASPWKLAVIDQLVIAHILAADHENDPLKAIQDLLAYHADIAVDPRVSGAAAKLVEQAKAEVESAATERANERANASWALMCEKMVAAEREACIQRLRDRAVARAVLLEDAVAALRARGQK